MARKQKKSLMKAKAKMDVIRGEGISALERVLSGDLSAAPDLDKAIKNERALTYQVFDDFFKKKGDK